MNVQILGVNYAPEPVGIGPYTAGMAQHLVAHGHNVTVVCAMPFYPQWKVDAAYSGWRAKTSVEEGVRIVRLPLYVPRRPDGKRRLLHHLSFTLRAQVAMLLEARRRCPDVLIAIAPSLVSAVAARCVGRLFGVKLWLHIQDFEVDAAFATGLLTENSLLGRLAKRYEGWALAADRVSSISSNMCAKLINAGISPDKVVEFRNWANIDEVIPLTGPSPYRAEWGIDRHHVAIYSGNIANKQGIEIVVDAARLLQHRKDLTFVVCGEGPNRARLIESARGLDNIQFHDLQPRERLSDLLGMARVHLLPQIADAADLVLPSKLTNMLASGRPVVATAQAGTSLATEIEGCGLAVPPADTQAFAAAIERLLDDEPLHERLSSEARRRAVGRWSRQAILDDFERRLSDFASAGTE